MELDEVFKTLLESDEQADRSVVLDDLRDYVTNIKTSNSDYEKQMEEFKEQNEKLKRRNGELFTRMDDRGLTQEKKEEKEKEHVNSNMSLEDKIMTTMFE